MADRREVSLDRMTSGSVLGPTDWLTDHERSADVCNFLDDADHELLHDADFADAHHRLLAQHSAMMRARAALDEAETLLADLGEELAEVRLAARKRILKRTADTEADVDVMPVIGRHDDRGAMSGDADWAKVMRNVALYRTRLALLGPLAGLYEPALDQTNNKRNP